MKLTTYAENILVSAQNIYDKEIQNGLPKGKMYQNFVKGALILQEENSINMWGPHLLEHDSGCCQSNER